MLCSECGCEMQIVNSFATVRDGAVFVAHDWKCRNRHCKNGARDIPSRRSYCLYNAAAPDANALSCCGAVLAYMGDNYYWVPESESATVEDGMLSAKCALCGGVKTADVRGKTAL